MRIRKTAVTLATVALASGVFLSPAGADSVPTYCSAWGHTGVFDYQACIEKHPGSMAHVLKVKNLSNTAAYGVLITLGRLVNRSGTYCMKGSGQSFAAWETRTFTCYSTRESGKRYMTSGAVNKGGHVLSPEITG
ncbi:hypothetical protein Aph01nite_45590 [Acrocarpospora phusangensis]|uniref:Streptomyces killer toxin-like beta/gamma crystallin domain-containing protein n=1 Tax=Acrocarpospora phusangensis TaxID=1070424 RepID=A0A919QBQ3_9ACTN|nr:hypothetical protein [Acrocarpospora phusangensis]GIH26249.1 hypothetical protein Aph01nite_45590 [Acrocarpospora phusangensis]